MKFLIHILITTLLLVTFYNVEAQQTTFSKVLYDSTNQFLQAYAVEKAFDNGYILVGDYGNYSDGIVIKIDLTGNIVWNKVFERIDNNDYFLFRLSNVVCTIDSCYLIIGNIKNNVHNKNYTFLIKMNEKGDTIWTKSINHNLYLQSQSILQTLDSGYILTGYSYSTRSLYITKLNTYGTVEWSNVISNGNNYVSGNSVKQLSNRSYIITGEIENPNIFYYSSAFLVGLSSTGDIIWSKKYQIKDDSYCKGNDIIIRDNGYIVYIVGYKIAVLKTDLSGNIIWNKFYYSETGYHYTDYIPSPNIYQTSDNSFIFVYGDYHSGGVIKTDTIGNILWYDDLFLIANSVLETNSKEFFILGNGPFEYEKNKKRSSFNIGIIQIDSLGNGQECVWPSYNAYILNDSIVTDTLVLSSSTNEVTENTIRVKINSFTILSDDGCIDAEGSVRENNRGNEIVVYPNPGNGIFTVKTNKTGMGKFIIYNCFGQKVYEKKKYKKQLIIDLSAYSSGIYFYKFISSDNSTITGKIITIQH